MISKRVFLIVIISVLAANVFSYQSVYHRRNPFSWWGMDVYINDGLSVSEVELMRADDRKQHEARLDIEHAKYTNSNAANDLLYTQVIAKLLNGTNNVHDMHNKTTQLVISFIQNHVEFANNSTKIHHEQVENLQKIIQDLVQNFLERHRASITNALKDHRNLTEMNKRQVLNFMSLFKEEVLKSQDAHATLINNMVEKQQNLNAAHAQESSNVILSIIESYKKNKPPTETREGNLIFYAVIGGGIFFGILLIALIFSVLFSGNKKDANYPMQYPMTAIHPPKVERNDFNNEYETLNPVINRHK